MEAIAKKRVHVGWKPPPVDFFKVNVNDAHNKHSGLSSCVGIIRDSNGIFVKGRSL